MPTSEAISPTDTPEEEPKEEPKEGTVLGFFSNLFKKPESNTEDVEAKKDTDGESENANKFESSLNNNPSPINRQHRDKKYTPSPNAVRIKFMSGENVGRVFDSDQTGDSFLGVSVSEISEEQSAKWDEDSTDNIRANLNFKGISPRTLDFSVTFFSSQHDVSHLVEQLYYMQTLSNKAEAGSENDWSLGGSLNMPPLLFIEQGAKTFALCVCTSISAKYSYPFPATKGFKQAEVSLKFSLLGGRGSPNMLASPLASTPFKHLNSQQTRAERIKEGNEIVIKSALRNGLGEAGRRMLDSVLENKEKVSEESEIMKLDVNTRIKALIAGILDKKAYPEEQIDLDIALILAETQGGASVGSQGRELMRALAEENPEGLPGNLIPVYNDLIEDYKIIKSNVKAGIDKNSDIFNADKASAAKRLQDMASGPLLLRQAGIQSYFEDSGDIVENLKNVNSKLRKMNKKEITKLLRDNNLEVDPTQVEVILGGKPYQTKQEFMDRVSKTDTGDGVNAYRVWGILKNQDQE